MRMIAIVLLTTLVLFIVTYLCGSILGTEFVWPLFLVLYVPLGILGHFRIVHPIAFSTFALKLVPRSAIHYFNRGVAYTRRGNYELALRDLEHTIELKPDFALAYYNRGTLYERMAKFQHAIQDFNAALRLNPCLVFIYNNRATTYVRSGDYTRAIKDYSHILALRPRFIPSLLGRGIAYAKLKDFEHALQDCEVVSKLAPRSIMTYDTLGSIYALAHDYQRAIENYDKALASPSSGTKSYSNKHIGSYRALVYANRSLVNTRLKNYQQALQDSNEAIALVPQLADAYNSRAQAHLGLMDLPKARADFARAYELFADSCQFYLLLVWTEMCLTRPDPDRAQRLLALADVVPRYYDAYVCQGVAFWLRGRFADAAQALQQAIDLEPHNWQTTFWTGIVCASRGKDEEAINLLRSSVKLGLPSSLLAPLTWLKQEYPEFYERYTAEFLKQNEIHSQV